LLFSNLTEEFRSAQLDHKSRKQLTNNNFASDRNCEAPAAYFLLNASTGYSNELPRETSYEEE